jgi:hypothetical protein
VPLTRSQAHSPPTVLDPNDPKAKQTYVPPAESVEE